MGINANKTLIRLRFWIQVIPTVHLSIFVVKLSHSRWRLFGTGDFTNSERGGRITSNRQRPRLWFNFGSKPNKWDKTMVFDFYKRVALIIYSLISLWGVRMFSRTLLYVCVKWYVDQSKCFWSFCGTPCYKNLIAGVSVSARVPGSGVLKLNAQKINLRSRTSLECLNANYQLAKSEITI